MRTVFHKVGVETTFPVIKMSVEKAVRLSRQDLDTFWHNKLKIMKQFHKLKYVLV